MGVLSFFLSHFMAVGILINALSLKVESKGPYLVYEKELKSEV